MSGKSSERGIADLFASIEEGELLESIFEQSGAANMIVDEDNFFLRVNGEFERITGYGREEVEGKKTWMELVNPDDLEKMVTNHRLRREDPEQAIKRYEYRFIASDGSARWGFLTGGTLPDGKRSMISVVDITELKKKEEDLSHSEARYADIVQTQTELISRFSPDKVLTFVNDAYCRYYGETREDLLGRSFRDHALPEDLEDQEAYFAKLTKEHPSNHVEERAVSPSGEVRWQHWYDRAFFDARGNLVEIQAVGRDITERKQMEHDLDETLHKLRQSFVKTVEMAGRIIEVRDPYTAGHQRRVAELASRIAFELGLSEETRDTIFYAGLVHDIGKIYVPSEILSKPGQLMETEWMLIKQHPLHSYEILEGLELPWPIAGIALRHHERLDGSGYPNGLSGPDIFIEERILAVADVVEAMASHRPYRGALGVDAALEEIDRNRDSLYDTGVVDACIDLFLKKGYVFGSPD